jgi:hypothetical protein
MASTLTPTHSATIVGYYNVEVFVKYTGKDYTTTARLLKDGTLIGEVSLPGDCPVLALTPLMSTDYYPHGSDDAIKAARLANIVLGL